MLKWNKSSIIFPLFIFIQLFLVVFECFFAYSALLSELESTWLILHLDFFIIYNSRCTPICFPLCGKGIYRGITLASWLHISYTFTETYYQETPWFCIGVCSCSCIKTYGTKNIWSEPFSKHPVHLGSWVQLLGGWRMFVVFLEDLHLQLHGAGRDFLLTGEVLLLLLYFRLTSFHLECVSVVLLFSQECSSQQHCDFGQLRVGEHYCNWKKKHFADTQLVSVTSISSCSWYLNHL